MERIKSVLFKDKHQTRLFCAFALVLILMAILVPDKFFTVRNFQSMATQFPELGFLTIAAALVLITGGIDLSVCGTAVLSGIVAARIMDSNGSSEAGLGVVVGAVAAALLVGLCCGVLNAILVARFGIAPMLATLGTYNLYVGLSIVITEGSAISKFHETFLAIGNGKVLGIPVPALLFVLAIAILGWFLSRTKLGYKLFVFGTNSTASYYSGIHNTKVLFTTYVVGGIVCSLAGLIMFSRTNSAKADFGSSYGLQALLVALLGGVGASGGSGKASGLLLSIITLQFISSGFNLLHVSSFMKDLIWGALLVLIMVLNVVDFKKLRKKTKKAAA